jgi:hypothetical protein
MHNYMHVSRPSIIEHICSFFDHVRNFIEVKCGYGSSQLLAIITICFSSVNIHICV